MDTTHTIDNLAGAATLEFCQTSDHTTSNATETGVIKSPGLGTAVRDPGGVPSLCTIYISVCAGCRISLNNKSTIDCLTTRSCFLQSASVTLEGFPMEMILFFNSSYESSLNVTSIGRSVELVFRKSPYDAVTGDFGFYIFYKVMRPEPISYAFDRFNRFGTISSKGFPNRYTSNGDVFKFQFEAAPPNNYLTLAFSDWYLSKYSKITIQRGYNFVRYDYKSDRPVDVTASGVSILITFETGIGDIAQNYIGFKATYIYSYGSPDDSTADVDAATKVFDSVFGGAINFEYQGPGVVDYVWVIPRSDLIDSGSTQLKLRIDNTTNLLHDALEIHSGPTSEGVSVDWRVGESRFSKSGFYIRLRSTVRRGSTFTFNAVFAWTGTNDSQCLYTDFECKKSLVPECLKSKDLACDGVRHCDDSTDEIGCRATSTPCPSYWVCRIRQQRPLCITRKCDGTRDCLDGSDEFNCPAETMNPFATTTWHQSDVNMYTNYSTLSIALPLVMLGIIIIIIVSFIACIAIRRKRHMSVIRRTVQHEAPPGASNTDRNFNYSAHFLPNSEVASPPPYGEVVLYNNQVKIPAAENRRPAIDMPTTTMCQVDAGAVEADEITITVPGFTTSPGLLAPPPYEEIAKPMAPVESSAPPPPPYLLSDETTIMQPPPVNRTGPRCSDEQRTSPRRTGEQRTSPRRSGEHRTSPRHSGEQTTSGSSDELISDNSQC